MNRAQGGKPKIKTLVSSLAPVMGMAILSVSLLGSCVTAPADDPDAAREIAENNDPIEPVNRAIFNFNRLIDTWFIKPAAIFYKDFLPPIVHESVHNVLNNLRAPVILANDVLQGDMGRAEVTVQRFVINSTVGVAGLRDPATEMGYPFHPEDFGQTLAVWGIDAGPYLVLPVLGPSNPRDAVGLAVDYMLDPLTHWGYATEEYLVGQVRTGLVATDTRADYFDALEDLERTSLDFYAAMRSLYRQRRVDQIANGDRAANTPAPGLGYGFNSPAPGDELSESR